MVLEFLRRRHARLRRQLEIAYRMDPWPTARIDRIVERLALTERSLARAQAEPSVGRAAQAMTA